MYVLDRATVELGTVCTTLQGVNVAPLGSVQCCSVQCRSQLVMRTVHYTVYSAVV